MVRTLFLLPLAFTLSGCIIASEKPAFDTSLIVGRVQTAAAIAPAAASPSASVSSVGGAIIIPPQACAAALPTDKASRNNCINLIRGAIEDAYQDYRLKITRQVGLTNETADIVGTGSSTIGAATHGTAATALSVVSALAGNVRSAFNSDALYQQSLHAIFKQMDADRDAEWARIQISMQSDFDTYPMSQANNDLMLYFRAGTIESALDSLDANAGAAAKTCKAASAAVSNAVATTGVPKVKPPVPIAAAQTPATSTTQQCSQILQSASEALSAAYNFGPNATTLISKLFPDGKTLSKSAYAAAKKCMSALNLAGEPIYFANSGSEVDKSSVLKCLSKPAGS